MEDVATQSADRPWGTILTVLTLLAVVYAWFGEPDDGAPDDSASLSSARPDPLVRQSTGWAPARKAVLTPGIQTLTEGAGQCTTNFVFTDAKRRVYLGQAAHCAGATKGLNGCKARSLPLGTRVVFARGASPYDAGKTLATGTLAYSSWIAMKRRGETDPETCAFNDFALIRIDPRDRRRVNPTMPHWGGPTGLAGAPLLMQQKVFGIGQSGLRSAGSTNSRQSGTALADFDGNDGWSHTFMARSPGIPGDSGSGYVDAEGKAVGTLSTMAVRLGIWNNLGDLRRELQYARQHSGIRGLRLELGGPARPALGR